MKQSTGEQLLLKRKFDRAGLRIEIKNLLNGIQVVTPGTNIVVIGKESQAKTIIDLPFKMYIKFPSLVLLNITSRELQKSTEQKEMIVSFESIHY